MKKTHKVVILPTNKIEGSQLMLQGSNNKLSISHPNCLNAKSNSIWIGQHIYIISDDEIKEGDWYITPSNNIVQAKGPTSFTKEWKKIVATTDESIGYTDHRISPVPNFCDYPQLPESFIQAFIKAYNEGKPITEVALEMELDEALGIAQVHEGIDKIPTAYVIKTRPDNTVIVHQSKMYSRDEVLTLCKLAYSRGHYLAFFENGRNPTLDDKWIQDNL